VRAKDWEAGEEWTDEREGQRMRGRAGQRVWESTGERDQWARETGTGRRARETSR
jgi:hypothetical protein